MSERQRILILGGGLSGLVLANLLDGVDADVAVVEQQFGPARSRAFHGLVRENELGLLGCRSEDVAARKVDAIVQLDPDFPNGRLRLDTDLLAVSHRTLLDGLRRRAGERGVSLVDGGEGVSLHLEHGSVAGLVLGNEGGIIHAQLTVLADESDPRLGERINLRPDWPPTQLMHVGKRRYIPGPDSGQILIDRADVVVFEHLSSDDVPVHGLIVPGNDGITVKVAVLLEHEMVTMRHVSEYLEEAFTGRVASILPPGYLPADFATEVVPVGGYGAVGPYRRSLFRGAGHAVSDRGSLLIGTQRGVWLHGDGALLLNDLHGLTHPLNRDGFSTTIEICRFAAMAIRDAVQSPGDTSASLMAYTKWIGIGFNDGTASRLAESSWPMWQVASMTELRPAGRPHVVKTRSGISAKLQGNRAVGFIGRLRPRRL